MRVNHKLWCECVSAMKVLHPWFLLTHAASRVTDVLVLMILISLPLCLSLLLRVNTQQLLVGMSASSNVGVVQKKIVVCVVYWSDVD